MNTELKAIEPKEVTELREQISNLESASLILRGLNEILFRLTERRPAASDSSLEARSIEMLTAFQSMLESVSEDISSITEACSDILN